MEGGREGASERGREGGREREREGEKEREKEREREREREKERERDERESAHVRMRERDCARAKQRDRGGNCALKFIRSSDLIFGQRAPKHMPTVSRPCVEPANRGLALPAGGVTAIRNKHVWAQQVELLLGHVNLHPWVSSFCGPLKEGVLETKVVGLG